MDAETYIESRLLSRQAAQEAIRCAPRDVTVEAGQSAGRQFARPAIARQSESASLHFIVAEIFKKTPCVPGLKPRGRDVAKDMPEVASIPLATNTLFDPGTGHSDCIALADGRIVENSTTVYSSPTQDNACSASPEAATSGAGGGMFNVKLTDKELPMRTTKRTLRATNHSAGALWNFASQVGPAAQDAVTQSGGAHEKQCYADI